MLSFEGMMPGVGFIGGRLSVVGGYSWPGGVGSVEQWDDDNAEWVRATEQLKLKYPRWAERGGLDQFHLFFGLPTDGSVCLPSSRFNHGTVTVPGDMFPQCADGGDPSQLS